MKKAKICVTILIVIMIVMMYLPAAVKLQPDRGSSGGSFFGVFTKPGGYRFLCAWFLSACALFSVVCKNRRFCLLPGVLLLIGAAFLLAGIRYFTVLTWIILALQIICGIALLAICLQKT